MEFVREKQATEIPAEIILQPGPAALTDGIDAVHRVIREWSESRSFE
jgi:iron complex transport system substrate-binding protein